MTSPEGVITREPRCPAFTNAGLFGHVSELVICEDEVTETNSCMCRANMFSHVQVFRLVECGSFRRLLKFCQPSLPGRDIARRLTLRAEILRRTHIAEEGLTRT